MQENGNTEEGRLESELDVEEFFLSSTEFIERFMRTAGKFTGRQLA